jgi:hypothetical protein
MVDELSGWQPDPFGVHEFRFFSDDGAATLLVRDGGINSYDKPPSSVPPPSAVGTFVRNSEPQPAAVLESQREFQHARAPEPQRSIAQRPSPMLVPQPQSGGPMPQSVIAPEPQKAKAPQPPVSAVAPDVIRSLRDANPNSHMRMQSPRLPPNPERHPMPVMSRPTKVAYVVVLTAMVASAIALVAVHLGSKGHPTASSSTTTTKPVTTTSVAPTTTAPLPTALQPSATVAAARLIGSWAAGNRAEALTVGTAAAVSTLFAGHYATGLVIDRGCSDAFSPIVCTYGPPGGAAPTDPVYEIDVLQAPAGWYVTSVTINN